MEDKKNLSIQKSVRITKDLYDRILEDSKKENRDFTKQLNYIVRQYYEFKKIAIK